MKILKTTIKTTIKATINISKRTFTIREFYKGRVIAKYRTSPMSSVEFDYESMNTESDWREFIRNGD